MTTDYVLHPKYDKREKKHDGLIKAVLKAATTPQVKRSLDRVFGKSAEFEYHPMQTSYESFSTH